MLRNGRATGIEAVFMGSNVKSIPRVEFSGASIVPDFLLYDDVALFQRKKEEREFGEI